MEPLLRKQLDDVLGQITGTRQFALPERIPAMNNPHYKTALQSLDKFLGGPKSTYRELLDPKRLPQTRPEGLKIVQNRPWDAPKGLWVCGETGLGKTRAICARLLKCGDDIQVIGGVDFNEEAVKALCESAVLRDMDFLTAMQRPKLLYLDDIGKRFTEAGAVMLHEVIERRMKWGKPTWASTNLDAIAIMEKFGSNGKDHLGLSLIRRIKDYFDVVNF